MYVGMTLVEIGVGIALNNRWITAFAVPALLVVHFIAVLPEEKYLSEIDKAFPEQGAIECDSKPAR